jgi:hypothetical protein
VSEITRTTPYERTRGATSTPAAGSTRPLPPLDYDETYRVPAQQLESTRPGKRHRAHRVRWFVLGIAFGTVAAVAATGDARGTLEAARAWGANALRALEHKPPPAVTTSPSSMATGTAPRDAKMPWEAPCPVEPAAGDPCAELLAPFAADARTTLGVPVVRVEDLPRVKPPAPVVVARRRRPVTTQAATAPSTEEEETTEETPTGVSPDADQPQTSPTQVPAASPPPTAERPTRERPATELSSRLDEPT